MEQSPSTATSPRPLRVLIAEDEKRDAERMVAVLARATHPLNCEVLDTPEKFRQRLQEGQADVVLCDFKMRDWNALDALSMIRDCGKDIPLILVTGALSDEDATRCLKAGAADFVLKDRLARLPVAIEQALELKKLRGAAGLREVCVLVLEDSEVDFEMMLAFLRNGGYRAHFQRATSRSDFERLLETACWDIILADYNLGEWTALDALAISRNLRSNVPMIIVSGSLGDEEVAACIRGGAADYILKDRMARLPTAMNRAMEIRAAEKARDEARAERARLMTAIEQSAEGVFITDVKGTIQYANPALTRVTGYSNEELLGKNPSLFKSGQQDKAFYDDFWTTILGGKVWRGQFVNRRKDGSLYYDEATISPVRDESGRITHFIASQRDITERTNLEEQLRQAQKMEGIGRLAGGIAHDFNNLLTVINGFSDLLLRETGIAAPCKARVEEIRKAGDRAAGLTRQLLAFSRRQVLLPQVLDLNQVVNGMGKMLGRLIGEDIELKTIAASGLGAVKADPGQIELVILNLAVNARDAMPKGGRLTIETANVELEEGYARHHLEVKSGPYVMLAVGDTGCGMDHETQKRLFEPFFTTKERGKGTGLGLATVYGIVKQSGGNIWVYSEPGRGSTFKVYLPRVKEAVRTVAREEAPVEAAQGTGTVLLVEDDDAVRALVRGVLESSGYEVLEANGPNQADTVLERSSKPIRLLLTDVVMPQMSGWDLARKLLAKHPEMKVLYMSGYTDNGVVQNGELDSKSAFLQKPFTPDALARKVREVLGTKRPR